MRQNVSNYALLHPFKKGTLCGNIAAEIVNCLVMMRLIFQNYAVELFEDERVNLKPLMIHQMQDVSENIDD